jgi:hypothetical protein
LRRLIFLFTTLYCGLAIAAEPLREVSVSPVNGFDFPRFVLTGRLGAALTIERCEYVSGLTCTIRLQPDAVLPTRIYSTELGLDGKALGPETRVLYPNLSPGERGRATLSLKTHPDRIALRGEWNGPWQDPY